MPVIFIRCYAELNDLLPPERRYTTFPLSLPSPIKLEDAVKNIGIQSGLIDVALVNNMPVDFSFLVKENDRVAVYPVFESFDVASVTKIRDHPLRQPTFILDVHLGKLSHYLRMFGFDALYQNNWTKESFIARSRNEHRIFLSRSSRRWMAESLTRFYSVKNTDPHLQMLEVLGRFDLFSLASPFTRCIDCNALLHPVEKETVFLHIPEKVRDWCQEYQYCDDCGRTYWKGSHYQHMNAFVQDILRSMLMACNQRNCSGRRSFAKSILAEGISGIGRRRRPGSCSQLTITGGGKPIRVLR